MKPVKPASPDRARTPRRHRSRQRDRILAWLQSTDSHPTAAQVHAGLVLDMPALSLGTVYRNLDILVAEGMVDEVACAGGVARYDANLDAHHHFNCERCGEIVDVDIPMPRGLSKGLEGRHGLRARRVSISFFGLCGQCEVPGTRIQRSSTMQRSNHEPTRSREQEGRHG